MVGGWWFYAAGTASIRQHPPDMEEGSSRSHLLVDGSALREFPRMYSITSARKAIPAAYKRVADVITAAIPLAALAGNILTIHCIRIFYAVIEP